jgi:hypothetical protein
MSATFEQTLKPASVTVSLDRLSAGLKDAPVDAVIIGIVDSVDVLGKQIYSEKN